MNYNIEMSHMQITIKILHGVKLATYETKYSKNTTLLQQPANTRAIAII